jgi:large subunit ribosomal protein L4
MVAMQVPVRNTEGAIIDHIELREDIFGVVPNLPVMHQAMVRQEANSRLGTHKTQRRLEMSRTTAKWYRQKGTGRARHGSRSATQFVGGGRPKGPQPRDYTQKMPRKMRLLALKSALSVKAASRQIIVLDALEMAEPRTRDMVDILDRLEVDSSAVIILPEENVNVEKSVHNIPDVKTLRANYLNIRDLLGYDYLVMPLGALRVIEHILLLRRV